MLWAVGLVGGGVEAVTVDLKADADRIPADGISTVTITAHIRDSSGGYVLGERSVVFSTTAGTLETESGERNARSLVVPSRSGVAAVMLRSSTEEVTATVTANLLGGTSEEVDALKIAFGSGSAPRTEGSRVIRIRAQYLRYLQEVRVVEALSEAELTHRGIRVEAPRLWFDLVTQEVIARGLGGGVRISSGGVEQAGDALNFSLHTLRGVLVRSGRLTYLQGEGLKEYPGNQPPTEGLFDPPPEMEKARTWIRAREITIVPQEQIQFKRAQFYMDEVHFLSLPYHIEDMGGYRAAAPQMVNYSSRYGLIVDIPFYLGVGENSTSALRLQRGMAAGYFTRNPGWGVQFEQQYGSRDGRSEGVFSVDRLGKDFGVRLEHRQSWGSQGIGSLWLDFPEHRDLFARADYNRRTKKGSLRWELSANRYSGFGSSLFSQVVWRPLPQRLPKWNSTYNVSYGLSYRQSRFQRAAWEPSLSVDLQPRLATLNPRLSVSGRLGLQYAWNTRQESNGLLNASVSFQQQLSRNSSVTLGYSYYRRHSSVLKAPLRQTLSLNAYASKPGRWSGYVYTSYDLDNQGLFASGSGQWQLDPVWRAELQGFYQDYPFGNFVDAEVSVGREVAGRQVRLVWSKSRHRFYLEWGEMGF
jgi:hypothetical protein